MRVAQQTTMYGELNLHVSQAGLNQFLPLSLHTLHDYRDHRTPWCTQPTLTSNSHFTAHGESQTDRQ